jgi:hypothetical protein
MTRIPNRFASTKGYIVAVRAPRRWIVFTATLGVALCAVLAYCFLIRDREVPKFTEAPTARIRFLSSEERLLQPPPPKRPDGWRPLYNVVDPVVPPSERDNPLICWEHVAVVRFENSTKLPLALYSVRASAGTPDGDRPSIQSAFLVTEEVRNIEGTVLTGIDPELRFMLSLGTPPEIPSPATLLARMPETFTLQPGEGVDLPISALGGAFYPSRVLAAGTYTLRASVSYAEAPSGETKQVISEPTSITVTAEQSKAAEAYYKARTRPE